MHTSPVADMISRIKNAYLAYHPSVIIPYSRLKHNLTKLLLKQGFIKDVKIDDKQLLLTLRYIGKKPALTDIKIISKPGLRRYVNKKSIPKALSGLGIVILSTSRGVMTGKEAEKKGLGGELLCQVW